MVTRIKMNNKNKGIALVLIATLFWSVMGITSRNLCIAGLDEKSISFFRASIATVCFLLWLLKNNREAFKIDIKGLVICSFYGVGTFAMCFIAFNLSVSKIPISIATVLMFTNSIWVTIFNAIFFKEKITLKKIFVIIFAMIGCLCIANILGGEKVKLDIIGAVAGVATGMLFALQIVIPRFYIEKYKKDTMLIYGFLAATLFLAMFTNFKDIKVAVITNNNPIVVILNILSIGFLSTFISNTFYVKATEYIDTSLTSILVALEPVLGSVFAFFIFGEMLNGIQIIGSIIILMSAIFLEYDFSRFKKNKQIKSSI
ncbi:DMT family transporter [Clostridium senegalense]|nr:EamA family transporter [Clostridium senegalense]